MIRIFLYIVMVIVAAWLITILANLSGFAVIELEGQRLDVRTSLLLGLGIAALCMFFFGGTVTAWLWSLPGKWRRRAEDRRRARGMTALTRGLEAVAAGDARDAQRYARSASKALEEPALTRLLTAQAAQLAGDRVTAEESYTAMLEAPETEFLGLRGLYMHALQTGEKEEARAYAERAFELRPGTSWAFESVLKIALENAAWSDALDAIRLARQNAVAEGPEFKRMEAALLTARAFASSEADDREAAAKDAEAALRKAPTITPAAALGAELAAANGNRSKAAKILGDAWEASPHPGLAAALRQAFASEKDERIEGRLIKLAERVPDHPESRLLLAETQLRGGEPAAAQETITPLLKGRPSRRTLNLMAEITEARYGAASAEAWRKKANAAPQDFIPGIDGTFHYTTEGWRRLIREFSEHERLAPPPLEVETPQIDAEEVRALLMPPPEPEPEDTDTSDEAPATDETGGETSGQADQEDPSTDDEAEPAKLEKTA